MNRAMQDPSFNEDHRRTEGTIDGRRNPTVNHAMAKDEASATMAVFFDLENIVVGVRKADYPKFDIRKVIDRLLTKGHIVVKKAYCDWGRFAEFKRPLHETAFELIEVPSLSQSGKNSADIRMVVDALDLCYTKQHVDTFVVLSGDSDFSPLVSKLRENAKTVIGVGVKDSSSALFISNCDEFIYYDDLVRSEVGDGPAKKKAEKSDKADKGEKGGKTDPSKATAPAGGVPKKLDPTQALERMKEVVEALAEERGDAAIDPSLIKEMMKRRDPGFNERAFGFKVFSGLLLEAAKRDMIIVERQRGGGIFVRAKDAAEHAAAEDAAPAGEDDSFDEIPF